MSRIRLLDLNIFEEKTPCQRVVESAAQYYAQPLKDLKLKAPLEVLYELAETDQPIGQWVANVPRAGDLAACLPKQTKRSK